MKQATHIAYYWTGGTCDCGCGEWQRCLPNTREGAAQTLLDIQRGGRVAHISTVASLDAIGLPDTPPTIEEFRFVGFL